MTSGPNLVAEPWGDSAVLFTAAGGDARARWLLALDLHRRLGARIVSGVDDWIHAYESVLVSFDCTMTETAAVIAGVQALRPTARRHAETGRTFEVPVAFYGEHAADLEAVADEAGLSVRGLIELLTSTPFEIGAVGVNMVPLLQPSGTDTGLDVARLESPRTRVPAGSLALAGSKAVLCSVEGPSGWRLVGRTPIPLFDTARDPMAAYGAGDLVRFRELPVGSWPAVSGALASVGGNK